MELWSYPTVNSFGNCTLVVKRKNSHKNALNVVLQHKLPNIATFTSD